MARSFFDSLSCTYCEDTQHANAALGGGCPMLARRGRNLRLPLVLREDARVADALTNNCPMSKFASPRAAPEFHVDGHFDLAKSKKFRDRLCKLCENGGQMLRDSVQSKRNALIAASRSASTMGLMVDAGPDGTHVAVPAEQGLAFARYMWCSWYDVPAYVMCGNADVGYYFGRVLLVIMNY